MMGPDMTTWNELLGVGASESAEQIKQRYRQLSIRVHPDKGGSTGLMQLVSEAYQAVKNGKGDHSPLDSQQSAGGTAALRSQVARLQKELAALQQENRTLRARQANNQIPAHLTAKIAKLEFDNRQWREHYQKLEKQHHVLEEQHQRLSKQHDSDKKESKQLNRELKQALSQIEQLETELKHKATPVTLKVAKPGLAWRWVLASWGVIAVLMLPTSHWQSMMSTLLGQSAPEVAQRVRIVEPLENNQTTAPAPTPTPQVSDSRASMPTAPMIQLTATANQWHVNQFDKVPQPYLALRSEQGSYVVANCQGEFYVYLNTTFQPLRVPPNLDYITQRQHFHVYAIPYGQGASIDSWQLARKVKIFDDTFVSEDLAPQLSAFEQSCQRAPGLTAANF